MPKISVIVPVYNVEKYLYKCINSILEQTFNEFELILVNDGSTDNSGNICDEYAIKDRRVIVIHKENGGLSSARNAGLDIAKGSYISFIDSDDWIARDMYETLFDVGLKNDLDIVQCGYTSVYENSEIKADVYSEEIMFIHDNEILIKFFFNKDITSIVCDKIYKKQLFMEIRFPVGQLLEDAFILSDIYSNAESMAVLKNVKYYYLQREGSIMKSGPSIHLMISSFQAYVNRIKVASKKQDINLYNKAISGLASDFFQYYRLIFLSDMNINKKKELTCELKNWYKSYRKTIFYNNSIPIKNRVYLELCYINSNFVYIILNLNDIKKKMQ